MADGALASAAAAKQISLDDLDIAVIIPCMNEEIAIGGMVRKLRELLPLVRWPLLDRSADPEIVEMLIRRLIPPSEHSRTSETPPQKADAQK